MVTVPCTFYCLIIIVPNVYGIPNLSSDCFTLFYRVVCHHGYGLIGSSLEHIITTYRPTI